MTTLNATEARSKLYSLIDETSESHEPIMITGKRSNAVLVSEADWKAMHETLYFFSVPGMVESIRNGLDEKLEDCSEDLNW